MKKLKCLNLIIVFQEGTEVKRKSLITLSGLKKENNESGSCDLVVTPVEYNPSVLSPMSKYIKSH